MSVKAKITEDMKTAMKQGDHLRKTTLRMLLSEIKYAQAAVDAHVELDEPSAIKVIMSYQKRLQKSLEDYPEESIERESEKRSKLSPNTYRAARPQSRSMP